MNTTLDLPALRRVAFGALGVLATAFGLVILLLPGLASFGPSGVVLDRVEATDVDTVLLVAGGLAVGALLLGARSGSVPTTGDERLDRRLEQLPTTPPEQVTAGSDQVAAAGLDADITAAIENGGEPYRDVQETLETTATAVYADTSGISRDRAATAVAAGTWTTDPVAAALLSDERGPAFGRGRTLRLLAVPDKERDERIRRTIAAIERLEGP